MQEVYEKDNFKFKAYRSSVQTEDDLHRIPQSSIVSQEHRKEVGAAKEEESMSVSSAVMSS